MLKVSVDQYGEYGKQIRNSFAVSVVLALKLSYIFKEFGFEHLQIIVSMKESENKNGK